MALSVGPSVRRSSKYFQKVLKERFLNLIDVRLGIIRLREASLSMVLSVGFQKIFDKLKTWVLKVINQLV